jgi:hypothetical protein
MTLTFDVVWHTLWRHLQARAQEKGFLLPTAADDLRVDGLWQVFHYGLSSGSPPHLGDRLGQVTRMLDEFQPQLVFPKVYLASRKLACPVFILEIYCL